jgi:ubiquinone/menaquinone biosynthesis C-methylase UbiE
MDRCQNPFDELVTQYDEWFDSTDGRIIFEREVACLRKAMSPTTGRRMEVGVGIGRFAVALGVTDGIDPSASMRAMAEQRGIRTVDAVGECLPYADRSFDGVLITTTLCFLADPAKSFEECHRVLKDACRLVVGLIPADSPWGRLYAGKAAEGHPIYSAATFHTSDEVIALATGASFDLQEAWSCLLSPPECLNSAEQPEEGIVPGAGFVAMSFTKACGTKQLPEGL